MSVLTVGGLVFSSDPRIGVVSSTWPDQAAGTWSLQIAEAALRDSGEYQCQVNTEPKESLDVTLVVRGNMLKLAALVSMKPQLGSNIPLLLSICLVVVICPDHWLKFCWVN